jgi:hypothetical protein
LIGIRSFNSAEPTLSFCHGETLEQFAIILLTLWRG